MHFKLLHEKRLLEAEKISTKALRGTQAALGVLRRLYVDYQDMVMAEEDGQGASLAQMLELRKLCACASSIAVPTPSCTSCDLAFAAAMDAAVAAALDAAASPPSDSTVRSPSHPGSLCSSCSAVNADAFADVPNEDDPPARLPFEVEGEAASPPPRERILHRRIRTVRKKKSLEGAMGPM